MNSIVTEQSKAPESNPPHFLFAEQNEEVEFQRPALSPWKVLIVDDDADVHLVTKLVLGDFEYCGRGLQFLQAYSAQEAKQIVRQQPDIAVAWVDVVMERDDAGLQLVKWLRHENGNRHLRIILRTGQPGLAPEESVIEDYEINDYRAKTELSSQKLKTSMMAALRSYRDIMMLEQKQLGVEMMLDASVGFDEQHSIQPFTQGLMHQLIALLSRDEAAQALNISGALIYSDLDYRILAGYGLFSARQDDSLSDGELAMVARHNAACLNDTEDNQEAVKEMVCRLTNLAHPLTLFIRANQPITIGNQIRVQQLVKQAAVRLQKLLQTPSAESELGDSLKQYPETLRRMDALLETLAKRLYRDGLYADVLNTNFIEMLGLTAMVHSVEKELKRDDWLLKAHTLNLEMEWQAGLEALGKMAMTPYPNWNGKGLYTTLSGDLIPLEQRLMALVDVFDTLMWVTSFKKIDSTSDVLAFIEQHAGDYFDPQMVPAFVELVKSECHKTNKIVQ
jgi:response regulator RpfG family c-di-GMP phosphodiesterase